jgi:hypothetical protein
MARVALQREGLRSSPRCHRFASKGTYRIKQGSLSCLVPSTEHHTKPAKAIASRGRAICAALLPMSRKEV